MLPLLPTRIHGLIDYLYGIVLIAVPYLFGFADHGAAQWTAMGVGLATLAMALVTDNEVSLARLVPMPGHLAGDAAAGVFLAASPWLFDFAEETFALHLGFGLFAIVASLTTRARPIVSAQRQEAGGLDAASAPPAPSALAARARTTSGRERAVALGITIVGTVLAVAFGWVSMVDPVQQGERDTTEIGAPRAWQLNFPFPHSPVQEALFSLHNLLFVTSIGITLLVTILVLYVVYRFRAARNPMASRTSHNAPLEVAWTVLPVVILAIIAVPTFRNLRLIEVPDDAAMTLKVTGRQWFWDYSYPDHGGFGFSAVMLPEDQLPADRKDLRLLATDNVVVLPVDTVIRVQVTAGDVIHAWGIPALGVMRDAIPGRLNETWMRIQREGFYYGACRELCGANHAFMPIAIQAVSKARFVEWVAEAQTRFAGGEEAPRLAAANPEPQAGRKP